MLLAAVPLLHLLIKNWTISILIPYIFFILGETLLFRTASPEAKYHLDIFWSYREWNTHWAEIITNIILFIPLGFLLGRLVGWKGILIAAVMSAAIEIVQLITHLGLFEIDDIIHNTVGAAIGAALHKLVKRYIDR